MTERIDHVAEANIWIKTEINERHDPDFVGLAQATATLALVEQQRVANLIAITALSMNSADFTKVWDSTKDTRAWRDVQCEVAAALGLKGEGNE